MIIFTKHEKYIDYRGGAFGNIIFKDGSPANELSDQPICGFFATTRERVAAGCTPEVKVLMLSVHDDDTRIVSAVQAGASGYILKDADHDEFLRIIRGTSNGEEVSSPFLPDRGARTVYRA